MTLGGPRYVLARTTDALLEALVAPSFSRVGYHVRRTLEGWRPPEATRLDDRVLVLTGATSGIGLAAAHVLARTGATLVLVSRTPASLEEARADLARRSGNERISWLAADMSHLDDVRTVAAALIERHPRVDALVHNAGALAPAYAESPEGIEVTTAAQLVGPFLLTGLLLPRLLESAPSRVLWMSSGGAYLAPLDVAALQPDPATFDGARQYARVKRAQIALAALWARHLEGRWVHVHALHPGWVDTPGLEASLPGFRRALRPLLRTPEEGADTLAWLAAAEEATHSTGRFWHDRHPRALHRLPRTAHSDTALERHALWTFCVERSGWEGDVRAIIEARRAALRARGPGRP